MFRHGLCSLKRLSINQVQQREQINPDDIHKVPIQPANLNGGVILWAVRVLPGLERQIEKQTNADHHVQGVHAGHGEIQREKDLGVSLINVQLRIVANQVGDAE